MDLNSRWRSAAFYRTAVCGLAKTAASKKLLAGMPGGPPPPPPPPPRELSELRSDEAAAVGAFSLDYAGTEGVDLDLFGPSSRDSTMVMASTAASVPE